MKIVYILPSLDSKAPIFIAKRLSDFFLKQGHEVYVFYFDDIIKVDFNCSCKKINMNEPIQFDDFDIVHSHMMRPDKYVAKYSHLINRAKTVTTIHCNIKDDLFWSYGRIVSFVYEKLWIGWLKKFDSTIQINDYLLEIYSKRLQHNTLIYNGISVSPDKDDYSEIIQRIKDYKSYGKKVLCSYSGIVERKGLFQILKLLKIRNDLAYICIGEGKQKNFLVDYAEKNNISDRIFFSSFKNNPYHVMKYADIFTIPSYSEGFSLALLEAGSVGASVVCSDISAFNKPFSSDEVTFFELDDIDSLSFAVDEAFELKIKKKVALKKKVLENFSEEKMFQNYKKLYEVLNEN
ncbi:MAG: glycosyltransferase [Treponema sp.]|nr:glycosyltransferase [Treponema sp.]